MPKHNDKPAQQSGYAGIAIHASCPNLAGHLLISEKQTLGAVDN